MDRFERARWWLSLGAALVPLQPRSKYIVAGWGPGLRRISDESTARAWFLDRACNVGLVLDGFVCADFDQAQAFESWCAGVGVDVSTLVEATARGVHVYWRAGEGLRGGAGEGCEFKASGVVTVAPSVHQSGAVYRVLSDAPVATLMAEDAARLFPFTSKAVTGDGLMREEKRRAVVRGVAAGLGLVARIKDAWHVEDEAVAAGVDLRPGRGAVLVGCCPFHSDEQPSLWVNVERQRWGCYSPHCPTNAGGEAAHDVINWRAYRRHGGDVRAAIVELAGELGLD